MSRRVRRRRRVLRAVRIPHHRSADTRTPHVPVTISFAALLRPASSAAPSGVRRLFSLVTLVASAVVLPPNSLLVGCEGRARRQPLYVPNIRFAAPDDGLLRSRSRPSPILHYWSLGGRRSSSTFSGRRSFSLAWRLGAANTSKDRGGRRSRGRRLAAYSRSALTPVAPSSAFFLLPTRAWELGLGGLLVLTEGRLRTLTPRASGVTGSLGLAMIAASAVLFNDQTPFPGVAALVPVLGTVVVVASGTPQLGAWPAPLLGWRPMRFVGKISYSLYLWHFPVMVLGAVALAGILPSPALVVLEVTAAVLLAAATYRWVEDPLRRGHLIGTIPRRNLATALAVSICVVLISLGTGRLATARFEPAAAPVSSAGGGPLAGLSPASGPSLDVSSSPGNDPLAGLIPASGPTLDGSLPPDLTPPLGDALSSEQAPVPRNGQCGLGAPETTSPDCVDGDPQSATTVVLFGDSHAMQWFAALEQTALLRHWRLVTARQGRLPV